MSSTYSQRVELLKTTDLDLSRWRSAIGWWLWQRPSIMVNNSNFENVRELVKGEITEARAEVDRSNFTIDQLEIAKELGDVGWAAISLLTTQPQLREVSDKTIKAKMNGYGHSSAVLDKLEELAGNFEKKTLLQDLTCFLSIWASALAGLLPTSLSPNEVLSLVSQKDYGNYPSSAFAGKLRQRNSGKWRVVNQVTGQEMSRESLSLTNKTATEGLRIIRHAHPDRKEGLKPGDYQPHLSLMLKFLAHGENLDEATSTSQESLRILQEELV